ncbi:hypothetical protein MY519_09955 [Haemophilus influenzae]
MSGITKDLDILKQLLRIYLIQINKFLTSVSQRKQVKRVIEPVRSINIPKHPAIPV